MTGTVFFWADVFERNQACIGACILNCSHTPEKDRKLREATGIREEEVFIAMIACGYPAADLKIAASPRKPVASTNVIH